MGEGKAFLERNYVGEGKEEWKNVTDFGEW